ncbi:hypothetical protein CEXT_113661 [Caerostris extrusa]|uniref:Uncharacterized protein n=1 Tax=Caerostris extrusa TaxID=172846 RepID=A0AAV4QXS8_CAEEX|nr:hypothetical protein CEXT_113661 [Caerostris extrusa]
MSVGNSDGRKMRHNLKERRPNKNCSHTHGRTPILLYTHTTVNEAWDSAYMAAASGKAALVKKSSNYLNGKAIFKGVPSSRTEVGQVLA